MHWKLSDEQQLLRRFTARLARRQRDFGAASVLVRRRRHRSFDDAPAEEGWAAWADESRGGQGRRAWWRWR